MQQENDSHIQGATKNVCIFDTNAYRNLIFQKSPIEARMIARKLLGRMCSSYDTRSSDQRASDPINAGPALAFAAPISSQMKSWNARPNDMARLVAILRLCGRTACYRSTDRRHRIVQGGRLQSGFVYLEHDGN